MSNKHVRMVDAAKEIGISKQLLLYWIKVNKVKHEVVLGVRVMTRRELNRVKKLTSPKLNGNKKRGKAK